MLTDTRTLEIPLLYEDNITLEEPRVNPRTNYIPQTFMDKVKFSRREFGSIIDFLPPWEPLYSD